MHGRGAQCQQCGRGLLHELLRVRVEVEGNGAWTVCGPCATTILARFETAHVEAGAILERAWQISEGPP